MFLEHLYYWSILVVCANIANGIGGTRWQAREYLNITWVCGDNKTYWIDKVILFQTNQTSCEHFDNFFVGISGSLA